MRRILAIDPATTTGWAFRSGLDAMPEHGVAVIDGDSKNIGRFLFNFRRWHMAIMDRLGPEIIYYEPPFVGNKGAVKKGYALQGQIELNCLDRRVVYKPVEVATWRTHFIGKGWSLPDMTPEERRAELKAAVQKQCRLMGWKPKGEDDADALGILDYACAIEWRVSEPTGLFAQGAT